MRGLAATFILFCLIAGHEPAVLLVRPGTVRHIKSSMADSTVAVVPQAVPIPVPDTIIQKIENTTPSIQTGATNPVALVEYSKTLIGTPYRYGSTDPQKGFDCSGFITHVFNHFQIKVPRSSVEYSNVGMDVNYPAAKPGDIILFTGTDSTIRVVGHMGIVVSNENNDLQFIHSTSGKQYGVTISELSPYYMTRFVRIARVFPEASTSDLVVSNEIKKIETKIKNEAENRDRLKNIAQPKSLNKLESSVGLKNKTALKNTKAVKNTKAIKGKKTVKSTKIVKGTKTAKSTSKHQKTSAIKRGSTKSAHKHISSPSKSLPKSILKKKKPQVPQKKLQSIKKKKQY